MAALLGLSACRLDGSSANAPDTRSPAASAAGAQTHGIALPSWETDDYDSPQAPRYLRQIADTGAGWVALTPTWYQDAAHDSALHPTSETASDGSLRRIIERAHSTGLKVLLKPHVDLVDAADRAEIRPRDSRAWFTAYTGFITHYARLAQELEVEEFTVGTELAGTSGDRAGWTGVVEAVRRLYRGPLVYAANYDEYTRVPFWSELDLIGIDAYWPLSAVPTADANRLERAWLPIVRELAAFSARQQRQVLFTEAGYVSQRGTTTAPYSWTVSDHESTAEQAAAYAALLASFTGRHWWAGVYWWMWDDWPGSGEVPRRLAYTPHGKPAEQVLRRWWA
jgi:hypothetical protein